jgi:hypothetical protein
MIYHSYFYYIRVNDTTTKTRTRYNEQFSLPVDCLLDLFVRQQLNEHDTIASSSHRNSTHLRLIKPVSLIDDFSTWQYDHLHGLFDLMLKPYDNMNSFPDQWRLADDAHIYCQLNNSDSAGQTFSSLTNDKPRTTSLDAFVQDICIQEDSGQSNKWCRLLEKEDIHTFENLADLSQSEWDKIQHLSMRAKKTLKAAVDRELVSVASERYQRRHVKSDNHETSDDETLQISTKGK